jgi:hypothetical protein
VLFRNQVFVTALGVGGVIGGTSGLVNAYRTCTNGSTARHHDGKRRDYLQTFSVRTDGTVGNGKAHAAISDGVEGLVAGSSGLGGPVGIRKLRTEGRGVVLLGEVVLCVSNTSATALLSLVH